VLCSGNPNGAATTPLVLKTVSGTSQGSNSTCVFLGNTLRFGGYDAASYTVYPIAGNRLGAGGQVATTLIEAWPTAIAPGTQDPYNPNGPASQTTEQLEGALTLAWGSPDGGVTKIRPNPDPLANSFAISFLGSLSSGLNGNGSGGLNSGSQQFSLYGFRNVWSNPSNSSTVVDLIDGAHGNLFSLASVQLCFASSNTQQSGLITITNSLDVSLLIKAGLICG
jgi:hypothetical protein